MIELSQVVCFLAIVEENSFSRAAVRLGLAQSAVSQKLRRLEDQVGLRLLDRTSRQVRLSPQGLEFVPFARQMIEAEVNARNAARHLREKNRNTLRVGGYNFLSEERIDLMQRFLAQVPDARLDVEHGTREEMLAKLREGDIDAMLCLSMAGAPIAEFDGLFIRRVVAHIVFPDGHPLVDREPLWLEDLSGHQLAISPGRQDAPILNRICEHLTSKGVELVTAPEADRRAILSFARFHGLPSLRWIGIEAGQHRTREEGVVVVPVEGSPLVIDHYLYTRRGPRSPLLKKFLEIAAGPDRENRTVDQQAGMIRSLIIPSDR